MKIKLATILQVTGSLMLCAAATAVVFGLASGSAQMAAFVLMVSLVHLLPAALLFCFLAWVNRINFFTCVVSGGLIASIPIGILTFPRSFSDSSYNAWSGGRQTIINGMPTLAGWLDYGQFLLFFIGIGTLAGAFFWLLIKNRFAVNSSASSDAEVIPESPLVSSWLIPTLAVLLITGVFLSPSLTEDRSCHNVLRDGRTSASPSLNAELTITKDDWRNLESFYVQFAQSNSLSFKGNIDDYDDVVSTLFLSMCSEPGLVIQSNMQHWAHRGGGPVPGRGVSLALFSLDKSIDWIPIARQLVAELNEQWPGQLRFRDGGGRLVSVNETLIADPLEERVENSPPWVESRWWTH